ncbi:hypothetical protein J6590_053688 [Homalodisca vitripennis]|nr:hypothetical protein J6590_053688 [Homalodisca vitripennis]
MSRGFHTSDSPVFQAPPREDFFSRSLATLSRVGHPGASSRTTKGVDAIIARGEPPTDYCDPIRRLAYRSVCVSLVLTVPRAEGRSSVTIRQWRALVVRALTEIERVPVYIFICSPLCAGVCGAVFHATCIKSEGDGVSTRSLKNWKCKDCRLLSTSKICGIPTTPQEDVKHIVKDLGVALGVEVQLSNMAAAHRIPSYNKSRLPAVVVQFHDRDIKEALLSKFREAKTRSYHLTADKINRAFPPGRVYVNDHLTPENKQFLAMLKKKCHDVGYVFVWCRDGKFFVRKAAGERVHRVSTLDDIDKLK